MQISFLFFNVTISEESINFLFSSIHSHLKGYILMRTVMYKYMRDKIV